MSQKNAARVLAFLAATSALAWMGSPVPATAAPDGKALASAQPTTRHMAVLKGSAGEVSVDVLALTHEIISPRDAASGLPTGKRQHKPFTITKPVDKSSPLLFESLVKGEPFQLEVTTSAPDRRPLDALRHRAARQRLRGRDQPPERGRPADGRSRVLLQQDRVFVRRDGNDGRRRLGRRVSVEAPRRRDAAPRGR